MKHPGQMVSAEQLIERQIARLIKENIGKGPVSTEVKITEDLVVCCFEGYLTKAEELIIGSGYSEKIIEYRSRYVTQCISEIETILKEILNRKIKSFFPSWIPEKNLACWTIFLD
ncbi:Protein of unknown function DUF2294 [Syntrophobotulus glycolicus DSM 8271]|uniref:Na+-translocating membrane potential-generating system MpsC domain-containing protein n=1 Tax=Syntrophobotulus glycolicus (strain DSM 8271 / FlGlyR) TaxID=645991 RepID=F0SXK7_SYNGF|nr:Na-translocating system protein MpsC family protein [Syntrophobotulus glycolicus]ADY55840.1 Protein of unknown function DUF2294 [Syntrophobotulus glycolicus DSM 8271]